MKSHFVIIKAEIFVSLAAPIPPPAALKVCGFIKTAIMKGFKVLLALALS